MKGVYYEGITMIEDILLVLDTIEDKLIEQSLELIAFALKLIQE